MKPTVMFALILSGAFTAAYAADPATDPSRPQGVEAKSWIPMGKGAGFVVTQSTHVPAPGSAYPVLSGYFMGLKDGKWVRLEPESEEKVSPAK